MGFGDYPAGESPFGSDPIAAPGDARRPMPRAARFDGATRSFLFEDDGQLADVHPVDQIVGMALVVVYGKMAGDPTVGAKFRDLPATPGPEQQRLAEREVARALAKQVADGDVLVLRVVANAVRRRGRVSLTVQYQNLRDPVNSDTRKLTVGPP